MKALFGRVALLAALGGGGGVLGACSVAHNQLNVPSSLCYPDLPPASVAVHHRGHFVGARLISTKALSRSSRLRQSLEADEGGKVGEICLVDFSGSFTSSQVEQPATSGATGTHAVVVFSYPGTHLLTTVVTDRGPVAFGKRLF